MTSKVALNTITLDREWLKENRIKESFDPFAYTAETRGTGKLFKLTQKTIEAVDQAGLPVGDALKQAGKSLGTVTKVLSIAEIVPDTKAAITSVKALAEENDGVDFSRKAVQAVSDVTGAMASWGGSALIVAGAVPVLGPVVEAATVTSIATELGIAYTDYSKAAQLEVKAEDPEVKKAITHSKNYYFYQTLKLVTALTLAILGIGVIITGLELMPVLAITLFVLFLICLSIRIDILRKSGEYQIIKFDQEVRLEAKAV